MAFNKVTIHYGLCTTFHCLEHKPQFLFGLRDRLQKLGYRVGLGQVAYIDYCMISMCDQEIFRCNIKNLKFSTHYPRDEIAQRAINAVLEATAMIKSARNNLWFRNLINNEMHARGPCAPVDYWPEDVQIRNYATCGKCVACCDIMVTKKGMQYSTSRCYGFNICSTTTVATIKD